MSLGRVMNGLIVCCLMGEEGRARELSIEQWWERERHLEGGVNTRMWGLNNAVQETRTSNMKDTSASIWPGGDVWGPDGRNQQHLQAVGGVQGNLWFQLLVINELCLHPLPVHLWMHFNSLCFHQRLQTFLMTWSVPWLVDFSVMRLLVFVIVEQHIR